MNLRAARLGDAPGIAEIWNSVIRSSAATFTTAEKGHSDIEALIGAGPVFVLEESSKIMGFAYFGAFRSGPGYRFVAEHSIYLAPVAQGRNLAAKLLRALETEAISRGIDVLIAGMWAGNEAAQRFHAKMGFVKVAHLPGVGEKFGDRHDLVLMQKSLKNTATPA